MLPSQILQLIRTYAESSNISPASAARYAYGSGDFYSRLVAGCDITSRRATRVIQWFSDNWPVDLDWPADIPRPDPAKDSPHILALAEKFGIDLNKPEPESEKLVLDDKGHLADPRALVERLAGHAVKVAGDPEELIDRWMSTYYQVVANYADGGKRAHTTPRAGTMSFQIVTALVDVGDVRFAHHATKGQRILAKSNTPEAA